jgi:hypothetical protein
MFSYTFTVSQGSLRRYFQFQPRFDGASEMPLFFPLQLLGLRRPWLFPPENPPAIFALL